MAILLSLITSILWAIFDVVRKKIILFLDVKIVIFLIALSQSILFVAFLFFSEFKFAFKDYFVFGVLLLILNIFSIYCFLIVIKKGEISTYIPMLSFTPLFSAFYAQIILNEVLVFRQYMGILFIILGALLLHSNNFKAKSLIISPILFLKNKNSYLIIIVALIWSLTPVLDKECMKYTDLYLHGFLQSFGMFVLVFLIYRRKLKKFLSITLYSSYNINELMLVIFLIFVGFLCTFFQLLSLKYNMVAELEALKRAVGVILSLIFGFYFFKEKIKINKIISVFVILLGVVNTTNFT